MSIDPTQWIQSVEQFGELDRTLGRPVGASQVAQDMAYFLGQAIERLDASQKAADQGIVRLVAGEPVDLHQVMLQTEEALVNLNLALQIRNKIIQAYQEIQRMQL